MLCLHAPLVLYYCRRRDSSCIMPTPPSTPVYSCYECRRAEWPADGLRFGGTDKEGKLLLFRLISPSSTPLTFLFPHPSVLSSPQLLYHTLAFFLLRYPNRRVSIPIKSLLTTPPPTQTNTKHHNHVSGSRYRPHCLPPWKGRPHHRCRPWYRSWLRH